MSTFVELATAGSVQSKRVVGLGFESGVSGGNVQPFSVKAHIDQTGSNYNSLSFVGSATASTLTLGGVGTGSSTVQVKGLADPSLATDAATKQYVDNVASGLTLKESVHVATAAALPTCVYNNGTSGVGATLTETGTTGSLTIDGHLLTSGDVGSRVLIKNQASGFENGIYDITAMTASAAWVLTRSSDFNATGGAIPNIVTGAFTFSAFGSTNADKGWVLTNDPPLGAVGTQVLTWSQFSTYTPVSGTLPIVATNSVVSLNYTGRLGLDAGGNNLILQSSAVAGQLLVSAGTATTSPSYGVQFGPVAKAEVTGASDLPGVSEISDRTTTGDFQSGGFQLRGTPSTSNGVYGPSLYVGDYGVTNTSRVVSVGDGTNCQLHLEQWNGSAWVILAAFSQ